MLPRPKFRRSMLVVALLASAFAYAQVRTDPGPVVRPPPGAAPQLPANPAAPRIGAPLDGLTAAEMARFAAGREEFINVETPETGLGPTFNGASCVQCHNGPAVGGGSPIRVTRFGRMVGDVFDPLTDKGGSLLQRFAIDPAFREVIPPEANVVADRLSTPLFGLGLIEAIPDATIIGNARARKSDGVGGRAAQVTDVATGAQRIGRFGWKAQHATLLSFVADAYLNEMGITNRFFPEENTPNGLTALLAAHTGVTAIEDQVDPVTGRSDIDVSADFIRFLAPPARLAPTQSSRAGESLFGAIGCAICHQPSMQTGTSPVAALDRKSLELYSDLLLHDMGTLGDGIAQANAGEREMRTPPLWGLHARSPFLHDGRAPTLDAAIRAHEGEAARSKLRYVALPPEQQRQLRDFLNTL